MTAYIAIVEDAGPALAAGVWFPDLPGCFSAGDDIDEALRNAGTAVALYLDALAAEGKPAPRPRSISEVRSDPSVAHDIRDHMIAIVPVAEAASAAE
jgi:predicted RNase H-like HicB family nuclease